MISKLLYKLCVAKFWSEEIAMISDKLIQGQQHRYKQKKYKNPFKVNTDTSKGNC